MKLKGSKELLTYLRFNSDNPARYMKEYKQIPHTKQGKLRIFDSEVVLDWMKKRYPQK